MLSVSGMAPFARTRVDKLKLPLAEVPALTIASDSSSYLHIEGGSADGWELQLCAMGEGNSEADARQYLSGVSMDRIGSLISLSAEHPRWGTGGHSDMVAQVPSEAPLTVHTMGAVEVRNMSGPVRISSANARATILNTTGTVDADGGVVDFSGGRGRVTLNSTMEIDIKLTGPRFLGGLTAYAQRNVRVLVPRGFESPIEVMVNRRKDLVCRADFCSRMKEENKAGTYTIKKYADNSEAAMDHVFFRSDHATVVIDNWPQGTFPPPIR